MALPTFPALEAIEANQLIMLRYIYDAIVGGGGVGGAAAATFGTYNKPKLTKKTAGGTCIVAANTSHSVYILAITDDVTYDIGGSVTLTLPRGTSILLTASTLFDTAINIHAGAAGEAHIVEMQPS
jgi:hypothetical protein